MSNDLYFILSQGGAKGTEKASFRETLVHKVFCMPVVPQSKIRVIRLACQVQKIGGKCGEILAICFCRFSSFNFQGEYGSQEISYKFLPRIKISSYTGPEPKFFHCNTVGVWGTQYFWRVHLVFWGHPMWACQKGSP